MSVTPQDPLLAFELRIENRRDLAEEAFAAFDLVIIGAAEVHHPLDDAFPEQKADGGLKVLRGPKEPPIDVGSSASLGRIHRLPRGAVREVHAADARATRADRNRCRLEHRYPAVRFMRKNSGFFCSPLLKSTATSSSDVPR